MANPALLNARIIKRAKQYLEIYHLPVDEKGLGHQIPSFPGLGIYIGLSKQQIIDLRRKKDDVKVPKTATQKRRAQHKAEFIAITDLLLEHQECRLLNGGLSGVFNSNIARMLLSNFGHIERKEITGADGAPLLADTEWTVRLVRPGEPLPDPP